MILESGIPYEFRTTVHPGLIDDTSLFNLVGSLSQMGVENFALQNFRPTATLPTSEAPLSANTIGTIRAMFPRFEVR